MRITRREFSAGAAGLLAGATSLVRPSLAQGAAKVVIIGGGPGGATVAIRLRAADPALDITLVESKDAYTTCFYSNLYIGGFRSFASITHGYDGLKKNGIKIVTDLATAIDTAAKTESDTVSAVEVADVVLVPCRPTIVELRAI